MKYRYFSLAAMALALILSCGKEEPTGEPVGPPAGEIDKPEVLPPLNEGEIAFRANGEFFYNEDSGDTDGVMSCFEDGTKASIFTVGYDAPVEVEAVNTQTNAYFVATAETSKIYYAVYPSSVAHSFESGQQGVSMSVTIPQEQDGSLSAASISVASSTGNDACMDFRNICGLLKFTTTSQNIKSVTFRGADDEDLIGTVNVSGFDSETGEPIFGGISQTCKDAKLNVEGRKGVFYVALLPGLTLEKGFLASFEMMPETEALEEAVSAYSMTLTRSGCRDIGNILDYIPQLNWFVTPEGGSQAQDGKSWETAISGEHMFQMIACNRPDESGSGNLTTDITSDANKENFADYLKIHNTKHVQQLDGVTFHIAQGEYSSTNYVRVSFPELGRKVRFTLRGGYDPQSVGKDLTSRDIAQYPTLFKAPSGSGTARMLFLQRCLDMTIDGLTFTGGMGDSSIGGGAVLLNESSTSSILFKDCTFTKNNSSSFGGAVTGANEVGEISFVGCVFSDNSAVKSGGAIRITGGTWNFTDCKFSGNKGTSDDSYGGAMYVKGADLQCCNCRFSENTSINNGGAVWLEAMTKADFIDCNFTSNESTANLAGAICLSGANPLNITGGVFSGNKAAKGGCIYNNAASIINITGTEFQDNESSTLGGVFFVNNKATDAIINMTGAAFSGNAAVNEGGSVYALAGNLNFTDCLFSNNQGTGDSSFGGAMYVKGAALQCNGCDFSGNTSVNNGGAVWMNAMIKADFIDCNFTSNVCTKNLAGAICLSGANPLNITGGTFKKNSAAEGGCIYNNAASTINITGTEFIENVASTGVAGVFYCNTNPGAVINIENAEFSGNTAAKEGSAILFKNGTWTVTNTVFKNNTSVSNGGAIYAHTGTLTLKGGSFSGNKTTKGSVGGGAIYVTTDAKLTVEGTTFSENSAQKTGETGAGKGGAICIASSAASSHTIKNATFTANTDALAGGALFIDTKAVEIDGCTFDGNSANGHGGAIYTTGAATFTIKNSTFEENVLNGDFAGGAIYSNATSTGNLISASEFISNSTMGNGGAIYWSGTGRLAVDKSYFKGNVATKQGAAIRKTNGVLYLNATSFTGNKSAGGRTAGVIRLEKDSFFNNCCFYGNEADVTHTDLVLVGGTTTVLNSTLYESNSTMTCIRVYNKGVVANLYNNVLLNPNTGSADGSVRVGYYANPGSITSPGYNYTTEWKPLVDAGVTGSVTMAGTDKVVAYNDVSGNFTSATTTDGRGYYTWTKSAEVTGTTAANVTSFLNGITGGTDFAAWLGTVDGLTKDIAGNNRPAEGWYPGCYQGN